jgi:uncharacterized protein
MKYILTLICLLSSVNAYSCNAKKDYVPIQSQSQEAMLYRIADCYDATKDSFIFGTFHTSAPEVIETVNYILPYLRIANTALFELVKTPRDPAIVAQYMFLNADSAGLEQLIGTQDFARLVALLEPTANPIPAPYLDRYRPWAASVMAQVSLIDISGEVLDDVLQRVGKAHRVNIVALETMQAQFEAFETLSQVEQVQMLKDTINKFDTIKTLNKEMMQAYLNQNLSELSGVGRDSFEMISDEQIAEKLETALVHKRNKNMVSAMLPYLKEGGSFTAIGALHLSGEQGMLQGIEDAGYYILPVKKP